MTIKIAYLILVHDSPTLVSRLIRELSTEHSSFYIHVDRKSDVAKFSHLGVLPRVHFIDRRVDCAWADFSLVLATLNLMATAMQAESNLTRLVLLSGSTLPVQPTWYIEDFFARKPHANYIEAFAMPADAYGKHIGRLTHYWLRRSPPFTRLKWKLQSLINQYGPHRNYLDALGTLQPMAGSQWWAITGFACQYILEYANKHKKFLKFSRHVDCPDEFFFQTILANSPFASTLEPSITYVNWRSGSKSPDVLGVSVLDHFKASYVENSTNHNSPNPRGEVLFARKFIEQQPDVIDALLTANNAKLRSGQSTDKVPNAESER